ncbi:MAG: DUF2236 domain-containing protein [Deltaproteobacteria bacterium]|nr:MAG: DUF2236 domain-containing protein [Deltaproteobacteria bacterium]
MIPTRVHCLGEARARYGDLADRLVSFLDKSDPLADRAVEALGELPRKEGHDLLNQMLREGRGAAPDAPQALHDLIEAVEHVPLWVNWERIEHGRKLLFRAGLLGGLVLGAKSLVHGYCAPAGNKPLVFTGRLKSKAARRINETARFVQGVCLPNGMRRNGEGFAITVKVRLMHAQVRRLLLESGRWEEDRWALPINQHDMLATNLLFSSVWLNGLRLLGFQLSHEESEDYMHLWRYVGYVMGVDPELLPSTEAEAIHLQELILLTQGPPDEDSKALVYALLDAPLDRARDEKERELIARRVQFSRFLCRYLVGDEIADQLGLPRKQTAEWGLRAFRRLVQRVDGWRTHVPLLPDMARRAGERYWVWLVEQGLKGTPADFQRPETLDPSFVGSSA